MMDRMPRETYSSFAGCRHFSGRRKMWRRSPGRCHAHAATQNMGQVFMRQRRAGRHLASSCRGFEQHSTGTTAISSSSQGIPRLDTGSRRGATPCWYPRTWRTTASSSGCGQKLPEMWTRPGGGKRWAHPLRRGGYADPQRRRPVRASWIDRGRVRDERRLFLCSRGCHEGLQPGEMPPRAPPDGLSLSQPVHSVRPCGIHEGGIPENVRPPYRDRAGDTGRVWSAAHEGDASRAHPAPRKPAIEKIGARTAVFVTATNRHAEQHIADTTAFWPWRVRCVIPQSKKTVFLHFSKRRRGVSRGEMRQIKRGANRRACDDVNRSGMLFDTGSGRGDHRPVPKNIMDRELRGLSNLEGFVRD